MPENARTQIDSYPTVRSPLPSPPLDDRLTLDLLYPIDQNATVGHRVIDLRDTVLVPAQSGPRVPPPQPVEVVRFGPGVPAVLAPPAAILEAPAPARKLRRDRALNATLTLTLAAIVIWLLWPAGSLHVRAVSARANPILVSCNSSADVVATVRTNGKAGQLKYRWTRNDGSASGTLVQSLSRGQHSVNLHLTWTFRGVGTYAARATVQLITPSTSSATVNFRYAC
jgi:hypothetical protein